MIEALKKTNGLVSLAAKNLGCAPKTIYHRAHEVQAVQQAIDDCREELVDIAELALRSCLTKQEPWAVALTLRTIGRHKGYVERQEITGVEGGAAIKLHWVGDEDGHNHAPVAPGADADSAE